MQTSVIVALRILSEADLDSDVAEWLGDNVKPFLDSASWMLSKVREVEHGDV